MGDPLEAAREGERGEGEVQMSDDTQWIVRVWAGYDTPDFIITASSKAKAEELAEAMDAEAVEVLHDALLPVRETFMKGVWQWPNPRRSDPTWSTHYEVVLPSGEHVGDLLLGEGPDPQVRTRACATYEDESGGTQPYIDLSVQGTDRAEVERLFDESFAEVTKNWPAWWWANASEREKNYLRSKQGS